MKTEEKIIRKMQILSNEYDKEEKHWRKDPSRNEWYPSFERYMLQIRKDLKVLSWVTGIKFDKFIKTK